jgi:hypothetical protein
MAHNIPATILGILAGTAVSMAGGGLLGAYVVSGAAPAYAEAPPRLRPAPVAVGKDAWFAPDPFGPIDGTDQDWGVRASGSSSE